MIRPIHAYGKALSAIIIATALYSCNQEMPRKEAPKTETAKPEYFLLRPELEKMYGYTQAVRMGNIVKVGGVISIDDKGNPVGKGDYGQQMANCYASLEKVLKHYGCTFDDVVLENIYTTSMAALQKNAAYRQKIYTHHFPTGSWIGVKELGLPDAMIEIEIEALISKEQ
ncbi:RidA family protein [Chitinophaga varians]|uniref:RidA family protein n=1 Tax=Chitinophaga varians TaxID=2202339 RepID=UPI00165F9E5B|nr:RidA family protein [Chitinophaga varians]MBC9915315.1 RidA family protein [Chitinophaga varians]